MRLSFDGFSQAVKSLVIASLCVFGWAVQAGATTVIDFGTGSAGAGGQIAASGSQVTGTNIPIDTVSIIGSALDGTYDVAGALSSPSAVGHTSGVLSFDTAANTLSIVGSIPSLGILQPVTLLTGSFSSFSLVDLWAIAVFTASGSDTKNPALLQAIGLPADSAFQYYGFSIGLENTLPANGPYTALSTSIVNTSRSVPEPSSMILLGTGALSFIGVARRRLRNSHRN